MSGQIRSRDSDSDGDLRTLITPSGRAGHGEIDQRLTIPEWREERGMEVPTGCRLRSRRRRKDTEEKAAECDNVRGWWEQPVDLEECNHVHMTPACTLACMDKGSVAASEVMRFAGHFGYCRDPVNGQNGLS